MKRGEASLQSACITWFNLQYPEYRGLLFHVPNGGSRNAREAANLKKQGVVAGVADLLLLLPRGGYGCLCIEMKMPKGVQSEYQRQWGERITEHGNLYAVCRSVDEFMRIIISYLSCGKS